MKQATAAFYRPEHWNPESRLDLARRVRGAAPSVRVWASVLLVQALLMGCSASSGQAEGESAGRPADAWGAIAAAEASGETLEVTTSLRRLRQDVERALAEVGWATLRIQSGELGGGLGGDLPDLLETTDAGEQAGDGVQAGAVSSMQAPPALRVWALLPDGRTATLVARVIGQAEGTDVIDRPRQHFRVHARVGRFGDAEAEEHLLHALKGKLEGKPLRQRILFMLPSP